MPSKPPVIAVAASTLAMARIATTSRISSSEKPDCRRFMDAGSPYPRNGEGAVAYWYFTSASTLVPPALPSLPRLTRSNGWPSPGIEYSNGWFQGSFSSASFAYGPSQPLALPGALTSSSSEPGKVPVSISNCCTFSASVCTCALARLALARSPPPRMRVAANATMPPISTTTRMISIRLKPDWLERDAGERVMTRETFIDSTYDVSEIVNRGQHRKDDQHHHAGEHQRDCRYQRGKHAVERHAGFMFERIGSLQQHRVERAGLLADLDHLQRQPREALALGQRRGQANAVLDVVGSSFDIGGQHPVPENVPADAERGQQRHTVFQQGAERT